MSEIERKKTEAKIEKLKDEELDRVAGGLFDSIFESIFDRCSTENPERFYNRYLCKECSLYELRRDQNGGTYHYCGKIQKVIKTGN